MQEYKATKLSFRRRQEAEHLARRLNACMAPSEAIGAEEQAIEKLRSDISFSQGRLEDRKSQLEELKTLVNELKEDLEQNS